MTLRESLQSEISRLQADLTAKQNELSILESSASAFLDQEAANIKAFVLNAWAHIFGTTPVPSDPPVAQATVTGE